MRKLIVMMLAMMMTYMPISVSAQSRANNNGNKSLTFGGVPFGIPIAEFEAKVFSKAMSDSLAHLVGAEECFICRPNVGLPNPKRPNIACALEVHFRDDYGAWVIYGGDLLRNILSMKYGNPSEAEQKGHAVAVWRLPYGEITLEVNKEDAIIRYYDYAALKKAYPNLYEIL